ncbi:hypothetical protein ACIPSE_36830 [Streptomyces sp. NPDC090106]|uniref:hypothetical protein n=1 Tax=Streptomyces sp. NPDC090106 TaxID=3365946 RepID=UPI0037FC4539
MRFDAFTIVGAMVANAVLLAVLFHGLWARKRRGAPEFESFRGPRLLAGAAAAVGGFVLVMAVNGTWHLRMQQVLVALAYAIAVDCSAELLPRRRLAHPALGPALTATAVTLAFGGSAAWGYNDLMLV